MITLGIFNIGGADVYETLATIFALRTHVPDEDKIDFKYVVDYIEDKDTIILSNRKVYMNDIDLDTVINAIPTGTIRTLTSGDRVVVYQYDI